MNSYTTITLGELLSSDNETIRRHALGILKMLQKEKSLIGGQYKRITGKDEKEYLISPKE